MKAIGLAALLVALATPAWAANVEADLSLAQAAYDVCCKTGGDTNICFMQHFSEASALGLAQVLINGCVDARKTGLTFDAGSCEVTLPYIKQRWGY